MTVKDGDKVQVSINFWAAWPSWISIMNENGKEIGRFTTKEADGCCHLSRLNFIDPSINMPYVDYAGKDYGTLNFGDVLEYVIGSKTCNIHISSKNNFLVKI